MSTTVDNRIVKMTFDNKDFENNAQQSLSTLDKLTQSLKFDNAVDGLKAISDQADKTKLTGLEDGVVTVQNRFSALQAVAFTCLQNITNMALDTGKNVVNALAIDPVSTGFSEYETQINAIQTILSNTRSHGTTIDDVNRALDTLNTYADKTIYNFTEMTRNIGTFTAAGIELEPATRAIQGIANLAAVSGSSAQQASTAMYQLSQALSAGKVSLQDWNSVVNAGMGGEVFQQALIRTSNVMGTGADEAIKKFGTFRESLTKTGWLTKEVLTETLNQLSGAYTEADLVAQGYTKDQAKEIVALAQDAEDAATKVKTVTQLFDTLTEAAQSGWTQSWEILVGDFYEARDLLTEISDAVGAIIQKQSDARNELLRQAFGKQQFTQEWYDKLSLKGVELGSQQSLQSLSVVAEKYGLNLNKMIEDSGSLKETLKDGWLDKKAFSTLMKYTNGMTKTITTTEEGAKAQEKLSKSMHKLLHEDLKDAPDLLAHLQDKSISVDAAFASMSSRLEKYGMNLTDFDKNRLKEAGFDEKQIKNIYLFAEAMKQADSTYVDVMWDLEKTSGRNMAIESIKNLLSVVAEVVKAIGKAWKNAFGIIDAYGVYNAIEAFRDWTRTLKITKEASQDITDTITPLFVLLRTLLSVTWKLVKVGFNIIKVAAGIVGAFLKTVNGAIKFNRQINKTSDATDKIVKVFDKFKDALSYLQAAFGGVAKQTKRFITNIETSSEFKDFIVSFRDFSYAVGKFALDSFAKLINLISEFFAALATGLNKLSSTDAMKKLNSFFGKLSSAIANAKVKIQSGFGLKDMAVKLNDESSSLSKVKDRVSTLFTTILTTLKEFGKRLFETAKNFSFDRFVSLLKTGVLVLLVLNIAKFFGALKRLTNSGEKVTKKFADCLDGIADTLNAYQHKITAEAVKGIAEGIFILAAAMVMLSCIPEEQLASITVDIAVLMLLIALILKVATGMKTSAPTFEEGGNALKDALINVMDGLKSAIQKALIIGAIGTFSVLLAAAVGIIVVAIIQLANAPIEKAAAALGLIGLLMGAIVVVSAFLNLYKNLDAGTGVALLGLAVAIYAVASAMKMLSKLDPEQIVAGVISIVAIMSMIALVSQASKGNNLISLSIGLLILSAALLTLIPSILLFSAIPWDTFGKGALLMFTLTGVMALAGQLATGTIAGALSILVLALAVNTLVPALIAFGNAWKVALIGIGVMAAALAVLVIFAALAGVLSTGMAVLAFTIGSLATSTLIAGAGFALMGAGAALLAGGIAVLATALPALANGLVEFCKTITDNSMVLVEGFGVIMAGIAMAIFASKGKIAFALVGVIAALIEVIINYGPTILEKIQQLLAGIWNWLTTDLDKKLISLGVGLAKGLYILLEKLFNFIGNHVTEALIALGMMIQNLFFEFIASVLEKIPGVGDDIAKKIRGWKTPIEKIFGKEEGKKQGKEYADALTDSAKDLPKGLESIDLGGSLDKMLSKADISGKMSNFTKKGTDSFNLDDALSNSIDTNALDLPMDELTNNGLDHFTLDKGMDLKLDNIEESFKDFGSFDMNSTGFGSSIKELQKGLTDTSLLDDFTSSGKTGGKSYVTGVKDGVSDNKDDVKSAAGTITKEASDEVRNYRDDFEKAGAYSAGGITKGLLSKIDSVRAAGKALSAAVTGSYEKDQDINSPSKVQMKNGEYTVLGLIKGITGMFPQLSKTALSLSDIIGTSLSSPTDMILDILGSDMNMSPVITPTIDMDQIDKGLNRINSSFGSRTISLSADTLNNANALAKANQSIQNRNDNNDIISQLKKLDSSISKMPRNNYNINGITYDDGSNIRGAIDTLVRAVVVEGRV